jgi:hypothetical protein
MSISFMLLTIFSLLLSLTVAIRWRTTSNQRVERTMGAGGQEYVLPSVSEPTRPCCLLPLPTIVQLLLEQKTAGTARDIKYLSQTHSSTSSFTS